MKNNRKLSHSDDALFVISKRDFQNVVRTRIGREFDEKEMSFAKNLVQEGLWFPSEISVKAAIDETIKHI